MQKNKKKTAEKSRTDKYLDLLVLFLMKKKPWKTK